MTPHTALQLQCSTEQQTRLFKHYDLVMDQLERGKRLEPALLSQLKSEMSVVLAQQPGFAALTANASRNQHCYVQLLHEDNKLLNLPWHLSVDHLPHFYLVKSLAKAPAPAAAALANPLPLKVLVMIAAPEDGGHRLSYEAEEDQIIDAFQQLYASGQVQIDFTEDGSLASLQRKLQENHYHILHFSGHGQFKNEQGFLLLEDEMSMGRQEVRAFDFASALNDKPEHLPALIVLSSCQTAQGNAKAEFKGVVNHLLEIGVPAVVAMGMSVIDQFATIFAADFYGHLAAKEPLQRAFRKALATTRQAEAQVWPNHTPGQWMIPQLYTTGHVEQVLDWKAPFTPLVWQNLKFITGEHALLLKQHEGYRFLGRRRERKQVLPLLLHNTPVLLKGQGGVGKTAMAEHLVRRMVLNNGRLQPFVFDENSGSAERVIAALIDYLQGEHRQFLIRKKVEDFSEKAIQQLEFLLFEISKLCDPFFVFDNLESFQTEAGGAFAAEHEDLREVIAFFYESKVFPLLLTGRYELADFPAAVTIDLNQVRFADFWQKCQQLRIRELEEKRVQVAEKTEPLRFRQVAEQLHTALGGNYRALELFDRLYQEQANTALLTLEEMASNIGRYQEAVLVKMSEDLVFKQLLALLSSTEREVLGTMSHYQRPVLPLALDLQAPELEQPTTALDRLHALTLLERHQARFDNEEQQSYYYLTPLVRGLLQQVAFPNAPFNHQAAGKYYDYVDQHINHQNYDDLREAFHHFYLAGTKDKVQAIGERLSRFYYSSSLYRLSLYYAAETERLLGVRTSAGILNRLGVIYHLYGKYDQALAYYKQSLAIQQEIGDRSGEGTTLNNISQIYDSRGDYGTALSYLEQSLAIRQEIGDRSGEGRTLNNIGQIYQARGDYGTALSYLEQSLAIQQEIGDRSGEGTTLNNIGQIYQARGDYGRALSYLEQSLAIRQEIGDRSGEGRTLNDMGTTAYSLGDYGTALSYLEQSLAIVQEIGDRSGEGTTLNNMATTAFSRGDYGTALSYLEQSLAIRQEIGDRSGEGTTLNNISQIYDSLGNYGTALSYLEQSLAIRQEIGDRSGEGTTLNNIGQIYQARGDYGTALSYYEQSLAIRQEIGNRSGEGMALNNISQIYQARGDYGRALSYLEQSLAIQQEIGDRSGEGRTLNNIGQIYKARGDYGTALSYLEQSLAIQQEIGDRLGEGTTLNNISLIYQARGDYDTALSYYEQSLAIQQKIGDRSGEGRTLNNISQIYDSCGDYGTALSYLEQSLAIQQEIGDRSGSCGTLHNMAQIAWQNEDVQQYVKYEAEAYQTALSIGDAMAIYHTGQNLGAFLCHSGSVEEGLPMLENSYAAAQKGGLPGAEEVLLLIQKFKDSK